LNDRLDICCRKSEAFAVGYDPDCLAGAVDNDLARLALAQMLFDAGFDFRLGAAIEIVAKLGKEVSATKHVGLLPFW
jgi:hypothetical protein